MKNKIILIIIALLFVVIFVPNDVLAGVVYICESRSAQSSALADGSRVYRGYYQYSDGKYAEGNRVKPRHNWCPWPTGRGSENI